MKFDFNDMSFPEIVAVIVKDVAPETLQKQQIEELVEDIVKDVSAKFRETCRSLRDQRDKKRFAMWGVDKEYQKWYKEQCKYLKNRFFLRFIF
jgi:hypothetical protein